MPITYGTPTDLAELLDAVSGRLAAKTQIHPSLVFPTLASDDELVTKPAGDTFLTVRVGKWLPIQAHFAGGGLPAFSGTLLVQLWTRVTTDQDRHARNYLNAVLAKWLLVFDALEGFSPVRATDATQGLTIEPMRAADGGFEVPGKKPQGWGRLDSAWNAKLLHRRPA